jgi:predicted small lipoprotein YifL
MKRRTLAGLGALAFALAGCGLKGPLYLPEKSGVITRPGPAGTTQEPPAQADTPTSPGAPPPPTPPDEPGGTDRG